MPHISELGDSKYLKKEDVGTAGRLLTITGCEEHNLALPGEPPKDRWCLTFAEVEKPFVLNTTNGQIIAGFLGSENTDDWINKRIVLYNDPNISFQGKLTGGIRARAPRLAPSTPPPATRPPARPPAQRAPVPPPPPAEEDPNFPPDEMP